MYHFAHIALTINYSECVFGTLVALLFYLIPQAPREKDNVRIVSARKLSVLLMKWADSHCDLLSL